MMKPNHKHYLNVVIKFLLNGHHEQCLSCFFLKWAIDPMFFRKRINISSLLVRNIHDIGESAKILRFQ